MKIPSLIVACMSAILLAIPALSQNKINAAGQDPISESARKIKDLQKERISTLKELVDQLTAVSRSGRGGFDEVFESKVKLHEAELAAAEKGPERIATQQKIVEVLSEYEKFAEAQRTSARGTASAVLKLKARRLQAEIDLEHAKIKDAKETKSPN